MQRTFWSNRSFSPPNFYYTPQAAALPVQYGALCPHRVCAMAHIAALICADWSAAQISQGRCTTRGHRCCRCSNLKTQLTETVLQLIAKEAVDAVLAGAAIVHLHARDPKDGRPVQTTQAFLEFVRDIKARSDGVINITTGGAPTMSVHERMRPALELKPELGSLNMGSMNFGLFPVLDRYPTFRHEWERKYLEGTKNLVFKNTFADIEYVLASGPGNGTRFEFEGYDPAHLYNLAHFVDRKLATLPFFVQTVFGILGGIACSMAWQTSSIRTPGVALTGAAWPKKL